MKSHNRIFLLTTNTKGTTEKLSQSYLFPTAVKKARNPVVFLFLCRFCIRDPKNVHTHSTQRVTITKFSNCTFKSKITDLDPSETQISDASRQDKVQIPKPCFLLYFLPFRSFFLLNSVPFCHLLYEYATFSFRGNPKEIYLVSKIFLKTTKVLHTNIPDIPDYT
jgi:hypothetical protein